MFDSIKQTFRTMYVSFTAKMSKLFTNSTIDEESLQEIERLLLEADTGTVTTAQIMKELRAAHRVQASDQGSALKMLLQEELQKKLIPFKQPTTARVVYLLIGVNGSGKTTFAGRFAAQEALKKKKVLLVAGDTFRAAAREQLVLWAEKASIDISVGKDGQDPGSVIFNGCQRFKEQQYDTMIIDTAGRLQTKHNLMQELSKIKRIIERNVADCSVVTLLTIDAMLGQNSFEQARLFQECTTIDGIVLTKMDGTGKGGVVFAINDILKIPVAYYSAGETGASIYSFDGKAYVAALLGS